MSDRSDVDAVSSGTPYRVAEVHGRPPQSLDDFVAQALLTLSVTNEAHEVIVRGSAIRTADTVLVHEKDRGGSGKDVRTWEIRGDDGGFVATERSTY